MAEATLTEDLASQRRPLRESGASRFRDSSVVPYRDESRSSADLVEIEANFFVDSAIVDAKEKGPTTGAGPFDRGTEWLTR